LTDGQNLTKTLKGVKHTDDPSTRGRGAPDVQVEGVIQPHEPRKANLCVSSLKIPRRVGDLWEKKSLLYWRLGTYHLNRESGLLGDILCQQPLGARTRGVLKKTQNVLFCGHPVSTTKLIGAVEVTHNPQEEPTPTP